jgi:hypothetical protein
MSSKLTLSMEKRVIEQAKEYAAEQGRSLSNIVEQYLKSVSEQSTTKSDKKFHPIVEELAGSVKLPHSDKDYKELITDALAEKYLK